MIPRPEWHEQAACRGCDPLIFFPDQVSHTPTDYSQALAICASCPVRGICLATHLEERHGAWGNTTPRQRQTLSAKREQGYSLSCEGCGAVVVRRGRSENLVWCASIDCQREAARRTSARLRQRREGVA